MALTRGLTRLVALLPNPLNEFGNTDSRVVHTADQEEVGVEPNLLPRGFLTSIVEVILSAMDDNDGDDVQQEDDAKCQEGYCCVSHCNCVFGGVSPWSRTKPSQETFACYMDFATLEFATSVSHYQHLTYTSEELPETLFSFQRD